MYKNLNFEIFQNYTKFLIIVLIYTQPPNEVNLLCAIYRIVSRDED